MRLTHHGLAALGSVLATLANGTLAYLFRGTNYSDLAFTMAVLSGAAALVLVLSAGAWFTRSAATPLRK